MRGDVLTRRSSFPRTPNIQVPLLGILVQFDFQNEYSVERKRLEPNLGTGPPKIPSSALL